MKKSIMLFVMGLLLVGCSKDLSRSEAKKQINKNYPQNITVEMKRIYSPSVLAFSYNNGQLNETDRKLVEKVETFLKGLSSEGYISYETKKHMTAFFSTPMLSLSYPVTFKDKIKPFIVKENGDNLTVLIATRELDGITGITKMDENNRVVQYVTKIKPNPLAKYFPEVPMEGNESRQAAFVLFDDGWRLSGDN